MGDDNKKISFGFSKIKKPTNLVKPVTVEKEEVQYVDAFDGQKGKFSYKGNLRGEEKKKLLVIPLVGTRTAFDVIKARIEENAEKANENGEVPKIKEEPVEADSKDMTIDDLAAKEILREVKQEFDAEGGTSTLVIPQDATAKPTFEGEKESTLEDYENVPVGDYGLAMLRGMGWKPGKGIGKNEQIVQTVTTKLRPKGLGLGAEKTIAQATQQSEELTIGKNSYVKITSGPHKGAYGQVTGIDGDTGRNVVKLGLGPTVSLSELVMMAVDKKEFDKNSKVLNAVKYEQLKDAVQPEARKRKSSSPDEGRKRAKEVEEDSETTSHSEAEKDRKRKKKNKKDKSRSHSRDRGHKKKRKQHSDSDSEKRRRRKDKKKRSPDPSDTGRRKHKKDRKRKSQSDSDSSGYHRKSSKKHKK